MHRMSFQDEDYWIEQERMESIDITRNEVEKMLDFASLDPYDSDYNKTYSAVEEAARQPDEPKCVITSSLHVEIKHDSVNHPSHYTAGKKEVIELIYESMTHEQFVGYIQGNVLKYMMRYRLKNGIEDLRKAIWYLEYLVKKESELNSRGI